MPITILLGTSKGAFLLSETDDTWSVKGPLCDGWPINHVVGDPETGNLWAGGGSDWHGAGVWRSTDGGDSWSLKKFSTGDWDAWAGSDPEVAKTFGWEPVEVPYGDRLKSVWSLHHIHGALYAGTKPAGLFKSTDGGASWDELEGIANHPSKDSWNPGAAGLVLHTILPDPDNPARMWVGISAAGVFYTEDAGETWERRNQLANADACSHHDHPAAPQDGQTGHCVHNIQKARGGDGDVLYQQNHQGVYRSDDGGKVWHDITEGLPSTFGFPITVDPNDPQTIFTIPLNGDSQGRYPPHASAAVWKSTDAGATWSKKQDGLPAENCFFTVLRQAMSNDQSDPVGLYFGTNTGSVFASRDGGENWEEIARHLPTILGVEALHSP